MRFSNFWGLVYDWFDWLHLLVLIHLSQARNDTENLLKYCKQNLEDTYCAPISFVGVNTGHPS